MSKVTCKDDWGGWDELDGQRLRSGDRLGVTWPDGTTEDVDVKVVNNDVALSRETVTYSRAHAIRDYHGVVVLVPIVGLEAVRRCQRGCGTRDPLEPPVVPVPEMTVLQRCELCDIPLAYALADGSGFVFAGHSPELCRAGTIERIQALEAAVKAQYSLYGYAAAEIARQVDAHLIAHGLPTLTVQRDEANRMRRELAMQLAGIRVEFGVDLFVGEVPPNQPVMVAAAVDLDRGEFKPGVKLGVGPGLGEMLRARGVDPKDLIDPKPGRR
jgi:hypothetical protein